jgi:hypothetical protein
MVSIQISIVVFVLLFGGALVGIRFDPFPVDDRLKTLTRANVQTVVGVLTSMFALLLSLQLSSGKTAFDVQEQDVTIMAAKIVMLDRVLAHYGPETRDAREALRQTVIGLLNKVWPNEQTQASTWVPGTEQENVYDMIEALSPKDQLQISAKTMALNMAVDLGQMRWKSVARIRSSTSVPLMMVEITWATIIFISFGLLAPRNAIVIISLGICAAAVAGGFFLIAEMNTPFSGLIHASSTPMREALKYLSP